MSYDIIRRSTTNPEGEVVATYPTKEAAEATRAVLNETTPTWLLQFFAVEPSKENK